MRSTLELSGPAPLRSNDSAVQSDAQRAPRKLHFKDFTAASNLHRDRFTHNSFGRRLPEIPGGEDAATVVAENNIARLKAALYSRRALHNRIHLKAIGSLSGKEKTIVTILTEFISHAITQLPGRFAVFESAKLAFPPGLVTKVEALHLDLAGALFELRPAGGIKTDGKEPRLTNLLRVLGRFFLPYFVSLLFR